MDFETDHDAAGNAARVVERTSPIDSDVADLTQIYAEILGHRRGEGNERRLVITVWSRSANDYLRVLRAVDSVRGRGLGEITVDASVVGATTEFASINLVVRPISENGMPLDQSSESQIDTMREELRAALTEILGEMETAGGPAPQFDIVDLATDVTTDIFADTHLGEVRFGITDVTDEEWRYHCALMLRSASEILAGIGIPIAYAHAPFVWRSGLERHGWPADHIEQTRWIRIGFGLPGGWSNDFVVAVAMADVASQHGWHLGVYDPNQTVDGAGMGARFVVERSLMPPKRSSSPDENVPLFAASTRRTAAVGLVRSMVVPSKEVLEHARVDSVSMAALLGQTILAVVASAPIANLVDANAAPASIREVTRRPDRRHVWMTWRCEERPGVAGRLIGAFVEAVRKRTDSDAEVEYAVTRVLEEGNTCAGKVRFSASPEAVEELRAALGREIAADLRRLLRNELVSWRPPNPAWAAVPVQVSLEEPVEEPWATLALRSGALAD